MENGKTELSYQQSATMLQIRSCLWAGRWETWQVLTSLALRRGAHHDHLVGIPRRDHPIDRASSRGAVAGRRCGVTIENKGGVGPARYEPAVDILAGPEV